MYCHYNSNSMIIQIGSDDHPVYKVKRDSFGCKFGNLYFQACSFCKLKIGAPIPTSLRHLQEESSKEEKKEEKPEKRNSGAVRRLR